MTDQFASPSPKIRLAACLVAAGFLFVAPAMAQNRQQQQAAAAAQAQADAQQDRIEELQRQLVDATAANENLQHQLTDAQREITRLRAMVGNLAQVNQDAVAAIQSPNAAQGQSGSPALAPDASISPPPPPAQSGPGSPRADLNGAADAGGKPLPPGVQGQLGTLTERELPALPMPTADDAYANARTLLVNGQYPEAEEAFGNFLQRYPNASTASDARFWYAFTLLARNNYQDAASNFVRYLQAAPNSPRAPEAQVRLGMSLAGMGQTQQACGAYSNLSRRYPNAPRNIRDLAVREARASHCPTN